jgi:hypothetical protein
MLRWIVATLLFLGLGFSLGLYASAAHVVRSKDAAKQTQTKQPEAANKPKNSTPEDKGRDSKKEFMKETVKEIGNQAIDRFISGGDNTVAHDIWEDVVDGNEVRAVGRALIQPSELSPKQDDLGIPRTNVDPGPPVVPAGPSNDTAITREQVKDPPVVPATGTNEAAPTPVVVPNRQDIQKFMNDSSSIIPTIVAPDRPVVPASPFIQNAIPFGGIGSFFGNSHGLFEHSVTPGLPFGVGSTVVNPGHSGDRGGGNGGGGGHQGNWGGPDHPGHGNIA